MADDKKQTPVGLATRLTGWLCDRVLATGRVTDSVHNEHGTYAEGFATLALALQPGGDPARERALRLTLRHSLARPRDSEFDQLALLLLCLRRPGEYLRPSDIRVYDGRRAVSRNWIAMRALNFALRARLTGKRADAARAEQLWKKVLSWQTSEGLFLDSPVGEVAPVTYHAKFCATLALEARELGQPSAERTSALERGLDALEALVSPSGVLVPYGRSRGALFGYAAAALALLLAGNPSQRQAGWRLVARMGEFLQSDGHIPCVLNQGEAERLDWDVYVNNPDYNAYAAALFSMLGDVRPEPTEPSAGVPVRQLGPLCILQSETAYVAVVTSGQSAPWNTPFFCDFRTYGMQPLWWEEGGKCLLSPVPYHWQGESKMEPLVSPVGHGWLPWLRRGKHLFLPRVYSEIQVTDEGQGVVRIEGRGKVTAYTRVARWIRGLFALLMLPIPQFWVRTLPLEVVRVLRFDLARKTIELETRYAPEPDGEGDPCVGKVCFKGPRSAS